MLLRFLQAADKTPQLFVFADMQVEFNNSGAVEAQQFLKMVDCLVPEFNFIRRDEAVHFFDQHRFVVGPVENDHFPGVGSHVVNPPQEVVRLFQRSRSFERLHPAALRIHGGKNIVDGAVLAAGVQRLEYDQQRLFVFTVQLILQPGDFPVVLGQQRQPLFLVGKVKRVAGIEV